MTADKTTAPERATLTIWAKPSRAEIIKWAETALRNSEINFIDDALIEDFADGLPALRSDLCASGQVRAAAHRILEIYDEALRWLLDPGVHDSHPDSHEMAELRRIVGAPAHSWTPAPTPATPTAQPEGQVRDRYDAILEAVDSAPADPCISSLKSDVAPTPSATTPTAQEAVPVDLIDAQAVADAVANCDGVGFWLSSSGCHELNEGYPTGPYSPALKCHLGLGCTECGGLGAIWDTTDYAAMGDWLAKELVADVDREAAHPPQPSETAEGADSWCDLKVAFDILDSDAVWAASADTWPKGWELNETDGAGARMVAVFRVDHLPTADETRGVAAALRALKGGEA